MAIVEEVQINQVLREFAEKLPRRPDGKIDYSHASKAPVLTCFVMFSDKLLLLKRSNKVRTYQGKWCAVAGYLDEPRPISEKAFDELKEELGLMREIVDHLVFGEPYEFTDAPLKKTWLVHPVLAVLNRAPEIEIDWEHVDFEWIIPDQLSQYDTVPKLQESLNRVLK